MCGILYVKRLDERPAAKMTQKRYNKQADRGQEGFGYMVVKTDGMTGKVRRFQFEHELKASLEGCKAREILLHHRFPTSTPNVPEATHPIVVKHPELKHDYYVVHNGVISNADELKDEHEKLKYRYTTELLGNYKSRTSGKSYFVESVFNDSEALAIELARTIEGRQGVVKARGAIAYIVLQATKAGKATALYYGSNEGNPLTVDYRKDYIVIASEGGSMLDSHKHYRLDLHTHAVTEADIKLDGHNRVGFVPTHGYSDGYDDSVDRVGTVQRKQRGVKATEMTLWELEQELEEVEMELQMARDEGIEAVDGGDAEREDELKYEIRQLETRKRDIEEILLRYSVALND